MATRLKSTCKAGILVAACVSLAICTSCSGQEETDTGSVLSDTEITLSLSEWTPMLQSRATTLFDDGDEGNILDEEKGGGNFTVHARVDGTGQAYMDGVRTWYFKDAEKWMMLDGNEQPITYYWPNSGSLNFFAFMPYNNSDKTVSDKTHVTVKDYSTTNGWQFECDLPEQVGDNTDMQEFIYAYETQKTKQNDPVLLEFHHPFALVNFKLKSGSWRMTVNSISFDEIYLNGIYSTSNATKKYDTYEGKRLGYMDGGWDCTNVSKKTYTATIKKRVPNEVNYNTYLSDWLIVMPQNLNEVKLILSASRSDEKEDITKDFTFTSGEWKPGHKYVYTITCGNNNEEIYFNVEVEKWNIIDYEQDINVE